MNVCNMSDAAKEEAEVCALQKTYLHIVPGCRGAGVLIVAVALCPAYDLVLVSSFFSSEHKKEISLVRAAYTPNAQRHCCMSY